MTNRYPHHRLPFSPALLSFVFAGLLLATPSTARAGEVSIQDCGGLVRKVQELPTNSHELTVKLSPDESQKFNDSIVTLENIGTGSKLSSVVEDGIARFNNVSDGVWRFCSGDRDLKVAGLFLRSADSSPTQGAVLGAAVLGGAAAIGLAVSSDGDSSGGDQGLTGSSGGSGATGGEGAGSSSGGGSVSSSGGSSSGQGSVGSSSNGCISGSVDPISPYF